MAWEDPQPRARPPDPRGLAHLAPGRPGSPAQPLKPRLPGKPCRPCGPAGPGLVASCAISGLKLSTLVISRSSASSAAVAISRRISRSVAASSPNNAFDRSLLSLTRLTRRLILFICAAYSGGYRPGEPSSSPQKMVPWPLMELKSAAPKRALPASPCTMTTTTAATNTATAAIAIAAAAPAANGRLLRSTIPCEAPPPAFLFFNCAKLSANCGLAAGLVGMHRARFLLQCLVLACLPALGRLFAPALRHELCAGLHSPAAGACALRAPDALCRLGAFSQPLVGAPGWVMAGGLTAHLRVHLSRQAGTWSPLKMTTSVLQSSPLAQLFNLFARKAAATPAEKDGRTGRVVRYST